MGGDPARGEDHRHRRWADEVEDLGPIATAQLQLETDAGRLSTGERTSFTCEELAPREPLVGDLTVAVWLDEGWDQPACQVWGAQVGALLAGDLDGLLVAAGLGRDVPGSPPPGGWGWCAEVLPPEGIGP